MFWAILISLIILCLAYILKTAAPVFEVRNTMFVIVGVFLVLYIAATVFVSYNIKAWSAEKNKVSGTTPGNSTYVYEETVNPTDLSTNP
ncbi:MAG: hypothetical protein WC750_05360 [Patescibacteria group bacterium]|jgi:hypothetical protein